MRVYISGPISLGGTATEDEIQRNLMAFTQAIGVVERAGHVAVSPTENTGKADGWIGYMRLSLAQLVSCEAIYLLPGWQRSKGCRCEAEVAGWLHLVDFGAVLQEVRHAD